MKAGDIVRFTDEGKDGELGLILHALGYHMVIMWSKLLDISTEEKYLLEIVSESR